MRQCAITSWIALSFTRRCYRNHWLPNANLRTTWAKRDHKCFTHIGGEYVGGDALVVVQVNGQRLLVGGPTTGRIERMQWRADYQSQSNIGRQKETKSIHDVHYTHAHTKVSKKKEKIKQANLLHRVVQTTHEERRGHTPARSAISEGRRDEWRMITKKTSNNGTLIDRKQESVTMC